MPAPRPIDSILKSVGRTPLVRLTAFEKAGGPKLYAKCEYLGPGGSIFDRAAVAQLNEAKFGGHLADAQPIVAAGGTDAVVSLAMVASASGHPFVAVVPRTMLPERKRLLVDYGARLVSIDEAAGLEGAHEKAMEVAREKKGLLFCLGKGRAIVSSYEAIARELVEALGAAPTLTVCGLDQGAIPTGIARGLGGGKLLAVEPSSARIGSGGSYSPHLMLGLAPGPEAKALDRSLVTDFEAVDEQEAWDMAERLARESGLLAGLASGAVLTGALRRASALGAEDTVVAVLPDMGERRFMLSPFFS